MYNQLSKGVLVKYFHNVILVYFILFIFNTLFCLIQFVSCFFVNSYCHVILHNDC